jgi:hypothetical protein
VGGRDGDGEKEVKSGGEDGEVDEGDRGRDVDERFVEVERWRILPLVVPYETPVSRTYSHRYPSSLFVVTFHLTATPTSFQTV